jgi:hypothetical protein
LKESSKKLLWLDLYLLGWYTHLSFLVFLISFRNQVED